MSRIRGKNTRPEVLLRSLLHRQGYRFRLHDQALPGRPDIVLKKYRAAVFVNGCFWHRHEGCPKATMPKSRVEFWKAKFKATVQRDKKNARQIKALGWRMITVWECELANNPQGVVSRLRQRLGRGA